MWFKNARVYRFGESFQLPENFESHLQAQLFKPCSRQDMTSFGWTSVFGAQSEVLHHAVEQSYLVCAQREEKVLPAAVVNAELEQKVQAIQDTEGRPVNGKEKKNLKEDITHQLLPQAFSKFRKTWAYIDLKRQLVIVDESSANKAEDLLGLLRASVGSLPVKPIALAESAEVLLTEWLTTQALPSRFDLGDELELRSPQADGGIIRCKQEDLTREDVQAHAAAGKQVVKLGLVWNEHIECVIEADWALKRIKATDQLLDDQDDWNDASPEQKLDSDLALVSAELGALLDDLFSISTE
ncbi:recombination-associated protein RdgC [Idiomarina sp. UBA3162]|uniref:recombination-associated protein RdgC n=1 Tax=Idiomarina sp. UBA3162 TaxID=1946641 RepID=UPI000C8F7961|nr:recombination-associated protein RdgC [Idiomarina sp. UBA3162]MAD54195.1 recombination-associated protein RdgC [Idiomarinaceae bacterium]|tara:strand:+ start:9640 stop:10533 length:894 start_codon:yes stop_codon:yes gene_type:complete